MSCPNSDAPKCCPPPKKPCPPGPPTCSNLPATLTFTCPASEDGNCAKKEEKPDCPPQPCPETCVALGNAKPEPISSGGEASSGSGSGQSGACATGGSPNSCEVAPLSMDGGKKC